jgi:6-pyruvoyl-tetrahydropterin synthase
LIDETVDHKLLVPTDFKGYKLINDDADAFEFHFTTDDQLISHCSPKTAVTLIDADSISIELVTQLLIDTIMAELPDNVASLKLDLHEEAIDGANYTYSHGLKKHDGNCQRIAHGHRSRIEIWRNDNRDHNLEQTVAEQWRDVYLGSQEDIESQNSDSISFAYSADQGTFRLTMPKNRCYVIPNDSTVECIAQYLAERLNKETGETVKVQAFEGVKKGAIHIAG